MVRKHKNHGHVNHERWLVSYADFITLLFAFFVVMYSVSTVNEGKFRALSSTMDATFKGAPRTMNPIQVGDVTRALSMDAVKRPEGEDAQPEPLDNLAAELQENFRELIDLKLLTVKKNKEWIELEMNSKLLFDVADISPSAESDKIMQTLAVILKKNEFPIMIEGFTDNLPIKNDQFPSNWDLAVARSATVVRLLVDKGISHNRLIPVGYGENFPISDNVTADGRGKNRRVVFVIQRENKRLNYLKENQFQDVKNVKDVKPIIIMPGTR